MDSAVIAALIAAGLAVVTCIVNLIVSSMNSKKNSNLKIIVKTRLKYMQSLRNANSIFIGISNPDITLYCIKCNKNKYFYPKELAEAAGILKTLLKPFYPIENRLLGMINSIENNCLNLFLNGETNGLIEKIKTELKLYIKLFTQYDWAFWQYIIKQADGKDKNSDKDFDEIYEDTRKNIISLYNYDWI
jgi:hypothetical protein